MTTVSTQSQKKPLGHIQGIKINITSPIKMDFDMSYNTLMIMVGQNGTGKTFILKLTWVFATMANYFLLAVNGKSTVPFNREATMQFLLDNSFTDHKMNGEITCVYENQNQMHLKITDGTIDSLDITFKDNLQHSAQPIFMSKETRLFDDMLKYLKLKKMLSIPPGIPALEDHMNKLLEMYRIYDIIYMEHLFSNIEHKTSRKFLEGFNRRIKTFDENIKLRELFIDYDKSDIFYSDDTHQQVSITTLGAGHQALINMILAQEYQNT